MKNKPVKILGYEFADILAMQQKTYKPQTTQGLKSATVPCDNCGKYFPLTFPITWPVECKRCGFRHEQAKRKYWIS